MNSAIRNRLEKNWKTYSPWAKREKIEAWRLYHRDIPEFPFIVDVYKDHFRVSDRSMPDSPRDQEHLEILISALKDLFQLEAVKLHIVRRTPQGRTEKYEAQEVESNIFEVSEGPLKFEINFNKYIDTGLFIDHREFRRWLLKNSAGKQVLNLFAYTGSLSVAAATGGASVTHVDLSRVYIQWAKRNFLLNDLDPSLHRFVETNVIDFVGSSTPQKYDYIIVDPPTFSNSKRMESDFDIQRDHFELLMRTARRLSPEGTLFFSTNKKGFRLDPALGDEFEIIDLTSSHIPRDFQGKRTQYFFKLTLTPEAAPRKAKGGRR